MITEETIARMKQNLEVKNEFFVLDVIKHLEAQIEKMKNCNNCRYNESSKKQNICTCNYCCNDCNRWELEE